MDKFYLAVVFDHLDPPLDQGASFLDLQIPNITFFQIGHNPFAF